MDGFGRIWEYQEACLAISTVEAKLASTEARKRFQKLHVALLDLQKNKNTLQKYIDDRAAALNGLVDNVDALANRLDMEQSEFEIMRGDEECTAEELAEETRALEELLGDIKRLKAKIMEVSEALSAAHDKLKLVITKGSKAKREYDAANEECEKERLAMGAELAELEKVREERAKGVDPELLKRFERIRKTHSDPVADVEEDKCSGCKMSLPTATVKRILKGDTVVECENCGRILLCREQTA